MPERDKKSGSHKESGTAKPKRKWFAFLRDERTPKIVGLTFILLSIAMFIAFTSYIFNWSTDYSHVKGGGFAFLFDSEVRVSNMLGRFGAFLGHVFIHYGFGLMSYIFAYLFLIGGINLLAGKSIFSLKTHLKYTLTILLFMSVALSYSMQFSGFPWGGAFGYGVTDWLQGFAGSVGTGILLFFTLMGILTWVFNIYFNFEALIQAFRKKEVALTGADVDLSREETEVQEWESQIELENEEVEKKKEGKGDDLALELENEVEEYNEQPEEKEVIAEEEPEENMDLEIEEVTEEKMVNGSLNTEYDPRLDLSDYKFPEIDLLEVYGSDKIKVNTEELENNKNQIIETLRNYNIEISKIKATIGPTVTLYEIIPAAGVRISKIKNLEDDIALSLAALGIRIIAPIPGKGTIGIEVPNEKKEVVSMRTLLASEKFQNTDMELPVALGKNIANEIYIADLAKMPHLLMAGATGQGKSVGINSLLVSLLYKRHPAELKLVLIDPKKVELSLFRKIENHYLAQLPGAEEPIITDTKKVVATLNSLCIEMDDRYNMLKNAHVRNIKEYNKKFLARKLNPEKGFRFLPYIVLVIDEFADLMMTAGKEVETPIARLAQLARAIGIHLVIATQRPSVNIITGTIKANFPARIAFKVTSKVDSRTILDTGGAEQLIGRGDMLLSLGGEGIRLQCGFVDTHEVERVTDFIGDQRGYPVPFELPEVAEDGDGGIDDFDMNEKDELFEDAARILVQTQQGSTSMLQRRLKLGYNRAGRLIDQLEKAGVVGPHEGSKAREVLITDEYQLEQFLREMEEA